jgi:hypothetical protein
MSSEYTGVYKRGKKFMAQIGIDHRMKYLGTHDTPKEAALAYDRAVTQHKLASSRLNFPNGLPSDDEDYDAIMHPNGLASDDENYDAIMNPKKKRRLHSTTTKEYNGVSKNGERFEARIYFNGKYNSLGTHDTPTEAAVAFDRAVTQHKLSSSKLNFPNGLASDDENYDAIMNPKKKRRLHSTNTSGYTGVSKNRKRFKAVIYFDGKYKHLGTHDTPKEAALAFDRAVIQHKLSSSKLNFPNDYISSSEDDESSNRSDYYHSSNDDDKCGEEAVADSSFQHGSQAQLRFVDPMLEQLFAEEQQKNNDADEFHKTNRWKT